MDINEFCKTHQIGPQCQAFRARLGHAIKDGWLLSHPHYYPAPLSLADDGSLDIFAQDRVCIEYLLEPLETVQFGPSDGPALERLSPCVLTLAVPCGQPFQAQRVHMLQEAQSLLTPLAEKNAECLVIGVCQLSEEYGHRFIRCWPMGIFHPDQRAAWVHPAAPAFGLMRSEFPPNQQIRTLGEPKDWSAWAPVIPADYEDPATGLPAWYARAQASPVMAKKGPWERRGAILNEYGRLLWAHGKARSATAGFRKARREFQAAMRQFFAPEPSPPLRFV